MTTSQFQDIYQAFGEKFVGSVIHLSKGQAPALEEYPEAAKKVLAFRYQTHKSGTLGAALLYADYLREDLVFFKGLGKGSDGYWTVQDASLEAELQNYYETRFAFAQAA